MNQMQFWCITKVKYLYLFFDLIRTIIDFKGEAALWRKPEPHASSLGALILACRRD